jgi:exosortase/archaeosortase family protein
VYLVKVLGAFCVLYFGSQLIIGLAAPGNYYSPFVQNYLDYPALLRHSLLGGTKFFLSLFGIDSYIYNAYYLRMPGGRGVHMVYSCMGIGVLSFWAAFIFANRGSSKKKAAWIIGGMVVIWLINMGRIALLFIATNKNQPLPFNLDNHTLFNLAAYAAIFLLIWLYDRSLRIPTSFHSSTSFPPSSTSSKLNL